MEEKDNVELPPLGWRHWSSEVRHRWLIDDGRNTVVAVYEVGQEDRTWVFYHLVAGSWVVLLECGPLGRPAGIRPRFASILGSAPDVDRSSDVFVVIERGEGNIWWLFYTRLRGGGVLLLFVFQARVENMVHEVRVWSSDESDESEHEYANHRVYDI